MQRQIGWWAWMAAMGLLATPGESARGQEAAEDAGFAAGVVFQDANRNGTCDPGEKGLRQIRVSNGRQVVQTDDQGRYMLPAANDTIVFVVKPSGWMTRMSEDRLPRFYYIHKPDGSPKSKYGGVAPTGPMPDSVDFPLVPSDEPTRFRVILFGDPQPRDEREIWYLARDVVEGLIGADAAFGVSLGDVLYDDLSLYPMWNGVVGRIGVPWHNVHGNHDMNYDTKEDRYADETFERTFGPATYSFEYGSVHFIALDDVIYGGDEKTKGYKGGLRADQLEFIRNDLALVPVGQLVVLMMHIPLLEVEERKELFALLMDRPHTLSISAHYHIQENVFFGKEDGWEGASPHHHLIQATTCGSWWCGAPDEYGIPHTMMRDGGPNGYSIATFDGNQYSIEYVPARRPADFQMHIAAPDVAAAGVVDSTRVLVNVFAGSVRSTVQMKVDEGGAWSEMKQTEGFDPVYQGLYAAHAQKNPPPGRALGETVKTKHLWLGSLPGKLAPGPHVIFVRTTDMYGRSYEARRIVVIR